MSKKPRQILIVDDHPIMRMGLAQLVGLDSNFEVCGEAGSANEAIEKIEEIGDVDMALVDISLPDRSGLELVKDLKVMKPELSCLVISSHDENVYAERILKAGGKGYIMKDQAPDKLIEAIKVVTNGGIFLSPEMTAKMMQIIAGGGGNEASRGISGLSDREFEVFRKLGEGKSSREIAGELGISIRTVDTHRTHIKDKMGLRDSSELTFEAIRWVEAQS
ncbi:MAG: response regulator transcription factor [Verrucomicrobiales bacterium]|nr:response regulator transcription factor [Verrucomicrobiales bacterium]